MRSPNVQELIRLGPHLAHGVRNDSLFVQELMEVVSAHESISPDARNKIEQINALLGHIAQRARQFLIITDTERRIAIDLRSSIRDLIPLFRRLLEGFSLQIEIDENVWSVAADDREQIEQILLTLMNTARSSMQECGSVRIRARNATKIEVENRANDLDSAAYYVLIEVSSTGSCLPKNILSRIFEPFLSSNRPDTLMLASVDFVIKRLVGRISVDPYVETGNPFNIFLPRYSLD